MLVSRLFSVMELQMSISLTPLFPIHTRGVPANPCISHTYRKGGVGGCKLKNLEETRKCLTNYKCPKLIVAGSLPPTESVAAILSAAALADFVSSTSSNLKISITPMPAPFPISFSARSPNCARTGISTKSCRNSSSSSPRSASRARMARCSPTSAACSSKPSLHQANSKNLQYASFGIVSLFILPETTPRCPMTRIPDPQFRGHRDACLGFCRRAARCAPRRALAPHRKVWRLKHSGAPKTPS